MPIFNFTEEELTHIKRSTKKLMSVRKNLSEKEWGKPNNKLVKELAAKFPEGATVEQSFILSRVVIRALLELTNAGHSVLSTTTIPEYINRIAASPDKKDFYQPYLDRAKCMDEVFVGLIKKLEDAL